MFKEVLETSQPIVYQTLKNALESEHLSHCYLFVGDKGTHKLETSFLLAQSLICENRTAFACEKCNSCRRMKENNYVDLIYIDEDDKNIKVELIENLQHRFEKTALEKAGKKIFIINNCERLTIKAANSLLKFIEEPAGNTTGIFITTQVDGVLPTIVSRSQTLNFKPLNKDDFFNYALEKNIDPLSAHLISNLISREVDIIPLSKNRSFNKAIEIFCQFIQRYFDNRTESYFYLQNSIAANKRNQRDIIRFFLDISLLFIQDYLNGFESEDKTYSDLLTLAKNNDFNYSQVMKAFIDSRTSLNKAANGLLLIDQLIYKLLEV
ncbi:MAG TPA: hypothetical protein PLI19_00570 [Erysipelotrichaceae bacterium]|nr:hypothetical protein [Erysipelotrichaceae bacterium]HQB31798.1 hypothetical protein [Erysipelotrichaceae bacterium]